MEIPKTTCRNHTRPRSCLLDAIFTRPCLLGSCVLLDLPSALVAYDQERGGMPLHDAIWINYKEFETDDI